MAYWGPIMLAWAAQLADDPATARRHLDEAEALLDAGSLCHNHIFFAAAAIDHALAHGAWREARRLAERLTRYMAPESLALTDFIAARARALAGWGMGDRSEGLRNELSRLRDMAEANDIRMGLAELERALAG
jgi:hypothetical protein